MESPDTSSYALSPERHPKRAGPPPDYPSADGVEKFTHVKFLVSNGDAGSVIGKGGSTITEFQTQSGARIQLSRSNEFFPGTGDRIIMISGATHEVLKAMELILFKLSGEINTDGGGEDFDQKCKVRLIVPNSCCGGIIGKGGVTIKSFIEDSQAGIKISPQDNSFGGGLNDRLVTLTGSVEEQMHAIDLILSKLTEDPHYSQSSTNSPYSYSSFHPIPYTYVIPSVGTAGYATPMNYGPNGASPGAGSGRFHGGGKEDRGTTTSITIGIADEHVGFVVGRGGRIITEISQSCGARIKISDRGDFLPGTSNRKVTISGSERAVQAAETMIMQQVDLAGER